MDMNANEHRRKSHLYIEAYWNIIVIRLLSLHYNVFNDENDLY